MRDDGLTVLPVFHLGSDLRWLRKYAQIVDYIGLGGMVGKSNRTILDRVFTEFPDPSEIGFHGFGVSSKLLVSRYPWRSIDTTAILMATIRGTSLGGKKERCESRRIEPGIELNLLLENMAAFECGFSRFKI